MTIPNVFVIPPEEDHSPAWCYFDAAQRQQLDHFSSTLVLVDSDDHAECDMHGNFEQGGDDSDVIEIFKVGRRALKNEPTVQAKQYPTDFTRSKTLKSRASRMFHSLKKVGKRKHVTNRVASSSVPHATQNTSEAPHAEWGTGVSETLPRRKSVLLSQLFAAPTGTRSQSSSSHSQDRMAPCPPHPAPNSEYYSDTVQGGVKETNIISPPRSPSPSPSFMAKRSFSKINLQKMFSFATSTSPLENISYPTVSNDLARLSSVSSGSDRLASLDTVNSSDDVASTSSSHATYADNLPRQSLPKGIDAENTMLVEHPSLAAELSFNLGTDLDLNLDVPDAGTRTPQVGIPPTSSSMHMNMDDRESSSVLGDISFEMCLDSLHFDDLSFDVNRF